MTPREAPAAPPTDSLHQVDHNGIVAGSSSDHVSGTGDGPTDKTLTSCDIRTCQLTLHINTLKIYPSKPLAILAGAVPKTASSGSAPTESSNLLQHDDQCLLHITDHTEVASLLKKWGSEIGNKKCTGWIKIAAPVPVTCLIALNDAAPAAANNEGRGSVEAGSAEGGSEMEASVTGGAPVLERNRAGKIVLHSHSIVHMGEPPTFVLRVMLDTCKFYPTKLGILDGSVVIPPFSSSPSSASAASDEAEGASLHESESAHLEQKKQHPYPPGQFVSVHVRSNVLTLMSTLGIQADDERNATGRIKLSHPIPMTCRIYIGPTEEKNRRGALLLECQEVLDIDVGYRPGDDDDAEDGLTENGKENAVDGSEENGGDGDRDGAKKKGERRVDVWRMNHRSFLSNSTLPIQHPRTERHRLFAQWLVDTYGVEALSQGSGVLDVAGGKGELSWALSKLGVKSVLLDPDPRCFNNGSGRKDGGSNEAGDANGAENNNAVPFRVVPHPLEHDGSHLTTRTDTVGHLVRTCSLIAGMHPDQATEAIVDTALRLGVPFAVLPCCVMPKLFPDRVQKRHGDPVRSYSTFVQYLLDKAPPEFEEAGTGRGASGGVRFHVAHLPFQGRNKVIYCQKPRRRPQQPSVLLCQEIVDEKKT